MFGPHLEAHSCRRGSELLQVRVFGVAQRTGPETRKGEGSFGHHVTDVVTALCPNSKGTLFPGGRMGLVLPHRRFEMGYFELLHYPS